MGLIACNNEMDMPTDSGFLSGLSRCHPHCYERHLSLKECNKMSLCLFSLEFPVSCEVLLAGPSDIFHPLRTEIIKDTSAKFSFTQKEENKYPLQAWRFKNHIVFHQQGSQESYEAVSCLKGARCFHSISKYQLDDTLWSRSVLSSWRVGKQDIEK